MHSLSVIPVVLLIESKKHDNLPHCFLSRLYCYSLLLANAVLSDKKHCFKRKERLFCGICLLKAQNTCHLWTSEKTFYIDKQMRQTFFFPDYGSAGITAIHGQFNFHILQRPAIFFFTADFYVRPPRSYFGATDLLYSSLPLLFSQLIRFARHRPTIYTRVRRFLIPNFLLFFGTTDLLCLTLPAPFSRS